VKVAPIECDLEQLVQRGDAAVTATCRRRQIGELIWRSRMWSW
jgi:hypothetical protein